MSKKNSTIKNKKFMTAEEAITIAGKGLKKEYGKNFLAETAFLLAVLYLLEDINKNLFFNNTL